MAEYQIIEIARKDQADVRFAGRLIAKVSSKDEHRAGDRIKDRWTQLELYELESGNWVACSIGYSDKVGESDFGDIEHIQKVNVFEVDDRHVKRERTVEQMRNHAMKFWGHTWLAKTLADREGWDVDLVLK